MYHGTFVTFFFQTNPKPFEHFCASQVPPLPGRFDLGIGPGSGCGTVLAETRAVTHEFEIDSEGGRCG